MQFINSEASAGSGEFPSESIVRAFQRVANDKRGQSLALRGMPGLSLFIPYSNLPLDGEVIPAKEEMCNPEQSKCKTRTYVFETKCVTCCGTGTVRGISNGRRGSLSTCIVCTGLGYVRSTTSRFTPPMDQETINRPQPPPIRHITDLEDEEEGEEQDE